MYSIEIVREKENIVNNKFAIKGIQNSKIAQYSKDIVNGEMELLISQEYNIVKENFKLVPKLNKKVTKLVYSKREILEKRSKSICKIKNINIKRDGTIKIIHSDEYSYPKI
jgi:hypothetical protein